MTLITSLHHSLVSNKKYLLITLKILFFNMIQFFRNRRKIALLVTSYGKIPGFQPANKFYRWVDKDGKPTPPPLEDGDLLMDVPEKKVCYDNKITEKKEFVFKLCVITPGNHDH